MAQHDYIIANQSGAAFRADLNNGLAAIVTNNSGASAPSPTYSYQWWPDTTTGLLKIRNAANNAWITVGTLASANLGMITAGTASIVNADVNASAGIVSSKLAFTQAGASAVTRTIDSKLKDVVSVADFGADRTGASDSLAAIQAAAAAHSSLYFPSGTYLLSGTLDLRNKTILAEEASFSCNHADIGVIIGGNQSSGDNPPQKIRAVTRVGGIYTIPAVRIIGAKNQQIWVKRCPYIQLYADTNNAADASCAYSSFWFNWVETLELGTNPSPSGSTVQWINENVFYLNRITTLRVKGTYSHNNNKFLYGSFETGTIDFQVGSNNRVEEVRGESGITVNFDAGTANNVVSATWQSSGGDFGYNLLGSVTDNGRGNHVGHQRWSETPLVPVAGFTYQTLKQHIDGSYNSTGVYNVAIGASSFTVGANQTFYDTGIITCPKASLAVVAQLAGRISGGYRIRIDGYDSGGNPIAGVSGDCTVRGVGAIGFGSSVPGTSDSSTGDIYAWIENITTGSVRIRFIASPNGLNATGFAVGLRYNNSDNSRSLALAQAGTFTTPIPTLSTLIKEQDLSDNVQATIFTFAIPAVSTTTHNVSFGFEVSYVIRCSRDSSTRSWRSTYGKVYGAISRGWENNSNAAPVFTITTSDQSLATTNTAPTITWGATLDAGTDNAAKNGYLTLIVDNPIAATNRTAISATINWVQGGGFGRLLTSVS